MDVPSPTLGIEEEYQIIDPQTRELRSYVQRFLEYGRTTLQDQIHPEFLQSQVEAGTRICQNILEARQQLIQMRRSIWEVAKHEGMCVATAGTHPFSSWARQQVSPLARYTELAHFLQDVGRRLLIFGMHVHIGVEDQETRIALMNQIRGFLPLLLALSTSSPFWHNRDTGLKSYRSVVFENLPRSGIPPHFESYADYQGYVDMLIATGSIAEPSYIWWDVRPSARFPTLEVRIPDMGTRIEETLCLAALIQAIAAKLLLLRKNGQTWPIYRKHLIDENKWRAARYGIVGNLINFDEAREEPVPMLAEKLVAWLDDVVDSLGSRAEVEYVDTILSQGTSADRQLAVYRREGNLVAVVDYLIEESYGAT